MGDKMTGGDLYHLWRVAEVHMPRIADVYYDASRAVGGATSTTTPVPGAPAHIPPTTTNDTDAFRQNNESPGGGMSSSVGAAWEALRNELQVMYADVGTTVLNAGKGLNRAMQAFVDEDQVGADELEKYRSSDANHDPDDAASNPPKPGSDEDPGKPDVPENYYSDTDRKVEEKQGK